METVIRLKDERRLLFQDAESMFQRDEGRKKSFNIGKKRVEVWDLSGFEIAGSPHKLRVVRYREKWEEKGNETECWMWLVTTLEHADGILKRMDFISKKRIITRSTVIVTQRQKVYLT